MIEFSREAVYNVELQYLENLRKFIVKIDKFLNERNFEKLNDEMNKQVDFILKREEEISLNAHLPGGVDIDFDFFYENKNKLKFGGYEISSNDNSNERFTVNKTLRNLNFLNKNKICTQQT